MEDKIPGKGLVKGCEDESKIIKNRNKVVRETICREQTLVRNDRE